MDSDSNIIHYTARSLTKQSPFKRAKNSKSTSASTNNSEDLSQFSLNREVRSFCCVFNHLTVRSCKFHSLKVYLVLLSLMALFTSMIHGGYMAAVLTSLQTQFNMSTTKIGFILSSFDIMSIFSTPLVSYFGSRYNKAKIISICSFLYSFGSIIFTFPYFFGERYSVYSNITQGSLNSTYFATCQPTSTLHVLSLMNRTNSISYLAISTTTTTTKTNTAKINCVRNLSDEWPYYIFILGQLLMSWGISPLFSLGITYLTENTEERYHAIYTGIIYGAYALGPAIGYMSASYFLSQWLYLSESPPLNITDTDPKWVGCWYLGFLVSSGFILIVSIILITFPDRIKRSNLNSERQSSSKQPSKQKNISKLEIIKEETSETFTELRNLGSIDTISLQLSSMPTTSTRAQETSTSSSISSVNSDSPKTNELNLTSSSSQTASNSQTEAVIPASSSSTSTSEATQNEKTTKKKNCCAAFLCNIFNLKIKGFISSFFKLIINIRYSLLILIMSIECILIAIFTHYLIIYSQNIYQISSSRSSILVGGVIVPAAIVGALLGGVIVRKFDLYIEGCTRLIMLSSIVVVAGICILLFVKCDGTVSYGINTASASLSPTSDCNKNCNCNPDYNPVCGIDKITYASPCLAGCISGNLSSYFNCTCVVSVNKTLGTPDVSMGACNKDCNTKLIVFLTVLFIVVTAESLCLTPITMLLLRLVDKPLQPFALGVLRMANILIAYIPSPIVMSKVIDNTCILWSSANCVGDQGSCQEYNINFFHYVLFGTSLGVKVVSCFFLVIFSLYIHKSYVLKRRYQNSITLNHDITSIVSSKQKYRVDEVPTDIEDDNVKRKSHKPTRNTVVLKQITKYEDSFTQINRSDTPDFQLFSK